MWPFSRVMSLNSGWFLDSWMLQTILTKTPKINIVLTLESNRDLGIWSHYSWPLACLQTALEWQCGFMRSCDHILQQICNDTSKLKPSHQPLNSSLFFPVSSKNEPGLYSKILTKLWKQRRMHRKKWESKKHIRVITCPYPYPYKYTIIYIYYRLLYYTYFWTWRDPATGRCYRGHHVCVFRWGYSADLHGKPFVKTTMACGKSHIL